MPSRLIHRHDQFFKRLLDKPGAAGALLHGSLPQDVAVRLSDEPPELLPCSFVPTALREYRTDRLYLTRTKSGRPVLILALVEHKSEPDPRIGLQLAGYAVQALEWWDARETEAKGKKPRLLPALLSLVVYNGSAAWTVPLSLAEACDADEELRPWLPNLVYSLVDLGCTADDRLSREEVLRIGFLILKYGSRKGDLKETLLTLGRAALALGFDDLVALVRYVLAEPNEVEAGILREVLTEIVPGQEERIMSIAAEQWKAEGIAIGKMQGLAEGEAKGKAEALERLLEKRFGPLLEEVRGRIRAADVTSIDLWFDRAITATDLEAVFGTRN